MPGGLHGSTSLHPLEISVYSFLRPPSRLFPRLMCLSRTRLEEFIGATTDKLVQSVLYIL